MSRTVHFDDISRITDDGELVHKIVDTVKSTAETLTVKLYNNQTKGCQVNLWTCEMIVRFLQGRPNPTKSTIKFSHTVELCFSDGVWSLMLFHAVTRPHARVLTQIADIHVLTHCTDEQFAAAVKNMPRLAPFVSYRWSGTMIPAVKASITVNKIGSREPVVMDMEGYDFEELSLFMVGPATLRNGSAQLLRCSNRYVLNGQPREHALTLVNFRADAVEYEKPLEYGMWDASR
jgi:hypothetical protein